MSAGESERSPHCGRSRSRRRACSRVYTSNFASYGKTYGALASIVVVLLWLWLSSLVVLAGAEVDGAHESHGS